MMLSDGAGSNGTLAIQGSSADAGTAPTPQANPASPAVPGQKGHEKLTYTWSMPAMPPSLQVSISSAEQPPQSP